MKAIVVGEKRKANNTKGNDKKKKGFFKRHKQLSVLIIVLLGCGLLNLVAWQSSSFCSAYQNFIFPIWSCTYGFLTSLLPFSFGELLIALAVFGIPISLIVMAVLLMVKRGRRLKVLRVFGLIYGWIIAFVCVTETLNCFVLYHTQTFEKANPQHFLEQSKFTDGDLENLGYRIVERLNATAPLVERDSEGRFVLTADTDATARRAVEALGADFKGLGGYTVRPKGIYCSFFMSQMNLTGIYFPFSMEANFNTDVYKAKMPCTVCHELAHTKGFMREEEANFIAFLACDRCENIQYRYSGYLTALTYIRNKLFETASQEFKAEFDGAICDEVWADIDANREYWQSVEKAEDTVFDSETVSEVSDKAMEASLSFNGVPDGKKSYGRMIDLMLAYYSNNLHLMNGEGTA